MVRPFWSPEEAPAFLKRTSTQYARLPFSVLTDRGLRGEALEEFTKHIPEGAIVAGGYMTSLMQDDDQAKDLDIFFTSESAFTGFQKKVERDAYFGGYEIEPAHQKALAEGKSETLRFVKYVHPTLPPLQLIKLAWYESAEHVIDTFDLTVAQVAADREGVVVNPLAIFDIARKRIVLHRMNFPASTLRRVIKYADKGYYACPGSLAKIAEAVYETILEDPSDTRKIVYVD